MKPPRTSERKTGQRPITISEWTGLQLCEAIEKAIGAENAEGMAAFAEMQKRVRENNNRLAILIARARATIIALDTDGRLGELAHDLGREEWKE
jgi:hypothetical protein